MNRNTQKFPMHSTERQSSRTTTQCDDWDTDPDFIRDIDEMEQRWGPKRTVGSINMNELINEVRHDHEKMREKFVHPSQRDHSEGFGGKFGVQRDRMDPSAKNYDYQEELSRHTSQEITRKVVKSSNSSSILSGGDSNTDISDIRKKFFEREESSTSNLGPPSVQTRPMRTYQTYSSSATNKPQLPTKSPELITNSQSYRPGSSASGGASSSGYTSYIQTEPKSPDSKVNIGTKSSKQFEKRTQSSRYDSTSDMPQREPVDVAYKSIRDKIDAFKKEFEDIENKVAKKADLSKVIKKTTNVEKSSNVQYVSRSDNSLDNDEIESVTKTRASPTKSSLSQKDIPSTSIKSLSEKFENLSRQDSDEFRRQTDAKRRDFFNKIENQVRETRKNLDGFDPIDEDLDRSKKVYKTETIGSYSDPKSSSFLGSNKSSFGPGANGATSMGSSPRNNPASPSSRPSSRLSNDSQGSSLRPKIYTRSETSKEEIVSRIVKENDKIVEDDTKRHVEHTSSCHGSSDDENDDFYLKGRSSKSPIDIRTIERELRSEPRATESPIDELKRRVPVVEPELKGAGLMARTLYDYQAAESDELSFDVDDLITNIEKVDPGWYKGIIAYKDGTKKDGLFPANYVRLLNDTDEH